MRSTLLSLMLSLVACAALATPPREEVRDVTASPAAVGRLGLERSLLTLPSDQIEGDASALYLQACLLLDALPRDSMLKLADFLGEPETAPLSADARDLANNFRIAIFPTLDIASKRTRCVWNTTVREQGLAALLPELGKFRVMARLLALQARVQRESGQMDASFATLRVLLDLGNRLAEGPTLIHALVGVAIQSMALNHLQTWAASPGAPNLYWALSELRQPLADLSIAVRAELSAADYAIPNLKRLERGELPPSASPAIVDQITRARAALGLSDAPQQRQGLAAAVSTAAAFPHAKSVLLATGRSDAEIDAMPVSQAVVLANLLEFREISDRQLRWVSRPFRESVPALLAQDQEIEALLTRSPANVLLQTVPRIATSTVAVATLQRRVEMFRTVEAIRLFAAEHHALPATLDAITAVPLPLDPLTLKPFLYQLEGQTAVISTDPSAVSSDALVTLRIKLSLRP